MPWSALPEHLNTPEKWAGKDWDTWYQRWMIPLTGLFKYGPRAKEKWARWRPTPKDLIVINGTRREVLNDWKTGQPRIFTSIINYWDRWSLVVQWPLHIAFHVYWPWTKVPKPGERPTKNFKLWDMFFFRIGARFDADQTYSFPSFFVGGTFN